MSDKIKTKQKVFGLKGHEMEGVECDYTGMEDRELEGEKEHEEDDHD